MTDFIFKILVRAENISRIIKETIISIFEDAREKLESVSAEL